MALCSADYRCAGITFQYSKRQCFLFSKCAYTVPIGKSDIPTPFDTYLKPVAGISRKTQTCDKDTGGTCQFSGCYASRNAKCIELNCRCSMSACDIGGACVEQR